MKVNVTKLQAGGYIAYQPTPMVPQQQPQPDAQQNPDPQEDSGYLDKNVMEKMLGKGITTDVMQYSGELQQAYQQYQMMNDFQRNSYKGRQIRNMLKGDLGQLNALMRSKDMFDDSMKNAKSNDALDEMAVTNNGMVVRNNETGKIDTVSFGQYAQDNAQKDRKYTALTNAQLAEQREYNKDLIGNSGVFSVLNFGKGMSKVQEEVLKIVPTIGRTSSTVANGAFDTNQTENVKDLVAAARAGAFKIKNGESQESNTQQIQVAKQALWHNLSENSKAVLRARAATMTTNPGEVDKYAQTMMAELLDPHTTVSTSKTYDETMMRGSKGGAAGKTADLGPYGLAVSGGTNTISLSQIGPQGVRIDGTANALPADGFIGKDGSRVPLRNAERLNNISYISKAFVANGDKVDPDSTVITGDAYTAELPYTKDENGNYKIDEAGSKQYALYKQELKEHNIADGTPQAMQIMHELGVQRLKIGRFVVAEATSIDRKDFFSARDKNYYDEVSGREKDMVRDIVDPTHDTKHLWGSNDAHKHLVFIPSKDLASYNNLDKNYAKVPEDVYDLQKGYNTGRGGNNTLQGYDLAPQSAQQLGFTSDSLNK